MIKKPYNIDYEYITDDETANIAYYYLARQAILGVDIETSALTPWEGELLSLQMGTPEKQFVFHMYSLSKEMKAKLLKIIEYDQIIKIFHNAKFDYKWLKFHYGVNPKNIVCTFIIENLLKSGQQKSGFDLDTVAKVYVPGVPDMDKDVRKNFSEMEPWEHFTKEEQAYSAVDVAFLELIYRAQRRLIKEFEMEDTALLECECTMATGDMELNGVYLNQEKWTALSKIAETQRDKSLKQLDTLLVNAWNSIPNDEKYSQVILKEKAKTNQLSMFEEEPKLERVIDINYNSPKQLKPVLNRALGFDLPNTNEKTLEAFSDNPTIEALLKYRGAAKRVSTYGIAFFNHISKHDGRIHTHFNQIKADSGRMSSSDPINLQNIPAKHGPDDSDYREPFEAQGDNMMISADYSSAELRILAEISGEQAWIDAFNKGYDMHSYVASLMFRIDYFEMVDIGGKKHKVKPEYKEFRSKAKAINFGVAYGKKAGQLARDLKVSYEEAQRLLDDFWRTFPKIHKFLLRCEEDAEKNNYALSPIDNRRRWFTSEPHTWFIDKKANHAKNIAKNLPFQGRLDLTNCLVYIIIAICKLKSGELLETSARNGGGNQQPS